ncbi:hypothetical protein GUITHDRAFT_101105 [Guillardia theta CCMP2712]|uniref:Uncharacterized protein n=1 Tax=Guillardia theta (strain CCMP2712) TaxID=905079 RepID=L1JZ77_GUITC|nr:hypothetical protein GUITHDRAFT_101105 [Guillardia theta CCMP2712]EKX53403.1 hypothetical protein GUITHDRAFT_101105 [Guillardia theta CCMP2712]|eukprot:XP_005840383.1 hypothetical protein GUITHDRAFT_101105 [Guillardia theta CCMP2712]
MSGKIEILSPKDGARIDKSDPKGFALHVRVHDFSIPAEGHGKIFLDDEMIAVMEESEAYFEVGNLREIEAGVHAITLRLYDLDENMVGIESSSKFELISHGGEDPLKPADDPKRGRGDGVRQQSTREEDPCAMDLSKTTVSGLDRASAGISNEFTIFPRNRRGLLIHPEKCKRPLELTVVVIPAPLDHRMIRDEEGRYVCSWTSEYAGTVKVEIKYGKDGSRSEHVQGSPFTVEVRQMYTVFAEGPINPKPSPYNGHYLHSSRERHHHIPEVARGDPLVEGGDKKGIDELCSGRPQNGLMGRCAFVTMISSDSYLSGSKIDFVGMVTKDGISPHTLNSLEKAGMILITVGRMKKQNIQDMSEERWNDNYTKLRLWQLPFERLVFLDCDMIVLQPLDHLFALKANFAAVPDAFHPCYLNTGFMFIRPHNDTFHAMATLIDEVSSEESEQTLVNHYYLDRYHVLHYTYNFAKHNVMSPTRFQIYVERYMDTVKVVHFLGVKPWMCSRDHDCMRHVSWYGGQSNMYLWWSMFEEMCELENVVCMN